MKKFLGLIVALMLGATLAFVPAPAQAVELGQTCQLVKNTAGENPSVCIGANVSRVNGRLVINSLTLACLPGFKFEENLPVDGAWVNIYNGNGTVVWRGDGSQSDINSRCGKTLYPGVSSGTGFTIQWAGKARLNRQGDVNFLASRSLS